MANPINFAFRYLRIGPQISKLREKRISITSSLLTANAKYDEIMRDPRPYDAQWQTLLSKALIEIAIYNATFDELSERIVELREYLER